ncbi:MAG: hypothetical protein KF830_03665 [Planctomycetes bacterium]|nr:hypothetical protein [Planctomycetota bacterium]
MQQRAAAPAVAGSVALRRAWPALAAAALAAAAAYASLLGHWFYSDDFVLLRDNRDLGLGGFLRQLLAADHGGREWVYWRPGWRGLCWLVHLAAGTTAWPYYLVGIVLHAAMAAVVAAIAFAATQHRPTAAAAGVLFAVVPSHAGAVAWIAAAFNVVPAALCLAAAGAASWRFARAASLAGGIQVVALVAVSLAFKEAAYASPLVFAAACATAGRAAAAAPGATRARLLVLAALAGLVVWHYLARSHRAPPAGDLAALLVTAHHAANLLRGLLPFLPAADLPAVGVAAVGGAALFVLAAPRSRFFLLWAVAALWPYVTMTHGERFAYFFHAPAVLFATSLGCDLARRWRPWAPRVVAAAWLAVAAAAALSLPAALAGHRQAGETCRATCAFVAEQGLAREPELVLDGLPLALENGFEAMLELFCGQSPRVVHLQAVRRPPFLLYLNGAFDDLDDATPVLQFAGGLRLLPKAAFLGDLVPLPMLSLVGCCRVVDDAAVQAALARPSRDLATCPLLVEPPPCTPTVASGHHVGEVAIDLLATTFDVDCAAPALLLIAFPVPVELRPPGSVRIDGQPAYVLQANGWFHAVCMPPGRHRVALVPALEAR